MSIFSKQITILRNLFFSLKMVFRSSPFNFTCVIFIQILSSVSGFVFLYFGKEILNSIDYAIRYSMPRDAAIRDIGIWIVLSAVLSVLLIFANYFNSVLTDKQQLSFGQYIDLVMSEKVLQLDISYFDNPVFYDKISSALDGKARLNFLLYRVIFFTANMISLICAAVIASTSAHWVLVLMIIILTVPALLTKGKYYVRQFTYENDNRNLSRRISYMSSVIYGKDTAKEIRFYQMSDFIISKYLTYWTQYVKGLKDIIIKKGTLDSLFNMLPTLGIVIAVYYILQDIISGRNGIGSFAYLFGIFVSLKSSFLSLIEDLAKLQESEIAIRNYQKFMDMEPVVLDDGVNELKEIKRIAFRHVSFRYPNTDRLVLNDVSFNIDAKEKTAIVGVNGAGKTTIINLLLRFYDPSSGEVTVNGVNIKGYSIESLRRMFSPVFQDFVTYSLSIRDNIAISDYKRRDADDDIVRAIQFAELGNALGNDTSGLERLIGKDFSDDGIELSGGQRQKLAIARCAFRNAAVLIMDEPDASLDPETEYAVLQKISELYSDKGLIMISHRLSNTSVMDRILVLEDGEITEDDSHSALLRKEGRYHYLFNLQAQKYAVQEADG